MSLYINHVEFTKFGYDSKVPCPPELQQAFGELSDLVIRDFIHVWFQFVSDNKKFPKDVAVALSC